MAAFDAAGDGRVVVVGLAVELQAANVTATMADTHNEAARATGLARPPRRVARSVKRFFRGVSGHFGPHVWLVGTR